MVFSRWHFKCLLQQLCLNLIGSGGAFPNDFLTKFCIKYMLTFKRTKKVHMTPTFHLKSMRTSVDSTEIIAQGTSKRAD